MVVELSSVRAGGDELVGEEVLIRAGVVCEPAACLLSRAASLLLRSSLSNNDNNKPNRRLTAPFTKFSAAMPPRAYPARDAIKVEPGTVTEDASGGRAMLPPARPPATAIKAEPGTVSSSASDSRLMLPRARPAATAINAKPGTVAPSASDRRLMPPPARPAAVTVKMEPGTVAPSAFDSRLMPPPARPAAVTIKVEPGTVATSISDGDPVRLQERQRTAEAGDRPEVVKVSEKKKYHKSIRPSAARVKVEPGTVARSASDGDPTLLQGHQHRAEAVLKPPNKQGQGFKSGTGKAKHPVAGAPTHISSSARSAEMRELMARRARKMAQRKWEKVHIAIHPCKFCGKANDEILPAFLHFRKTGKRCSKEVEDQQIAQHREECAARSHAEASAREACLTTQAMQRDEGQPAAKTGSTKARIARKREMAARYGDVVGVERARVTAKLTLGNSARMPGRSPATAEQSLARSGSSRGAEGQVPILPVDNYGFQDPSVAGSHSGDRIGDKGTVS